MSTERSGDGGGYDGSSYDDGPPEDDGVLEPADALDDDDLSDDPLDAGIEPPDHWSAAEGFGNTLAEARRGESLDQLLAEEEPEEWAADTGRTDVETDEDGYELDTDPVADPTAEPAHGTNCAEQAAMHIIEEDLGP